MNQIANFDSLGINNYYYYDINLFWQQGVVGDLGKVRTLDLHVHHALLYGEPELSWRHITMRNIWDTREIFNRKMIPYVRLISHDCTTKLPSRNSLWVVKPVDDFDFAKLRKGSHIYVDSTSH
ncbi:hypothetical protein Hanom_Chr10g00911391 [Helianthus anomalus]